MSEEIIDESEYLRVTTPLKRFSGYDRVPTAILNQAADRGTRVHSYCDLYANNMLFGEVDQDCEGYVQAFVLWFDENVEQVIFTEKRFFCEDLKIQGMPDLVCKIKSHEYNFGYCLADIKTSLNYSKTWDLQTAAYRYLCAKNEVPIQDRIIVHLHKDATFEMIEYKDYDKNLDRIIPEQYIQHLSIYKSCLDVHRYFVE